LTVFYPGAGHTDDNIVVNIEGRDPLWRVPDSPRQLRLTGNTAMETSALGTATEAVAARFPDSKIVVPSHGPPAGRELLAHTIALARAASAAKYWRCIPKADVSGPWLVLPISKNYCFACR
jgi:hypothetical protein